MNGSPLTFSDYHQLVQVINAGLHADVNNISAYFFVAFSMLCNGLYQSTEYILPGLSCGIHISKL